MTFNYSELARALAPEAALVLGALALLGVDLTLGRMWSAARRAQTACALGLLTLAVAFGLCLRIGVPGPLFGGTFNLDPLGLACRCAVLALTAFTFLFATDAGRQRHQAEFVAIVLFAASGFLVMAVAQQLLLAFLAIELASLSLYVLTGFDKTRRDSAEAGLKYFLFGGMSAGFLLFGFSLLYGLTGSIDFNQIAAALAQQAPSPLLAVSLVMILVAFGFKAAAAPFHLWGPDVYQGAPAPAAALIASASKVAGLALFVRLLWPALGSIAGNPAAMSAASGWLPIVAVLSLASLLLGNIGALAQTNLRRLLAYSAIAHAGALLLGVMVAGRAGLGPLFYYAATYGVATVGAFGIVAVLEHAGVGGNIADLAGLHRRSPLLGACLFVFVLSLAGIPPLAGFFGKFTVFAAAIANGGLGGPVGWLAITAILLSAVALYYYLVVLKQALVADASRATATIAVPLSSRIGLLAAAGLVIALGLFPSTLLRWFTVG